MQHMTVQKSASLSVRLTAQQRATLGAVAERWSIPPATLARKLIVDGLTRLAVQEREQS